ncbi:hypothetical protein HN873_017082, partial [Arachis hypogaea]
MNSQSVLHFSSTHAITVASSSYATDAATTASTITPVTMASASSSFSAIIATATASASGVATTTQLPHQFNEDDDVQIIPPPSLVADVAQFYNEDGSLRSPNLDIEITALWKGQVFLPFKVTGLLYSFLGTLSTQEQIESVSSFFSSPPEHLPLIFCKNVRLLILLVGSLILTLQRNQVLFFRLGCRGCPRPTNLRPLLYCTPLRSQFTF